MNKALILVIADNPTDVKRLTMALSAQGYFVQAAFNKKMAFDLIQLQRPDLILLDHRTPNLLDYRLYEHLKTDQQMRDTALILTHVSPEAIDEGSDFSVDDISYLTKPFSLEAVLAAVKRHLSSKQQQKHPRQVHTALDVGQNNVWQLAHRFQALLTHSNDIIAILDKNLYFRYLTPSITTILGYQSPDIIGKQICALIHPDDRSTTKELFDQAKAHKWVRLEARIQHQKGDWRTVEGTVKNLVDDPVVNGIVMNVRDITSQKRAEQSLRQHQDQLEAQIDERTAELLQVNKQLEAEIVERRMMEKTLQQQQAYIRQVIDTIPHFIFAKDRQGRFTLVNQAVAEAYGASVADLLGKTDAHFNPNLEEVAHFQEDDLAVMDSLQTKVISEEKITDAKGRVRFLETIKRPIIEDDGRANQVVGVAIDITQRRQAEDALRRSEEQFRLLFELAPIGMGLVSLQGRFLKVNHALCDTVGYTAAELLQRSIADITHSEDLAENLRLDQQIIQGKLDHFEMEKRYIRKDGQVIYVILHVTVIRDLTGHPLHFIGQVLDITERKKATNILTQHKTKLENELQAILTVNRALVSELNLNSLLNFIINQVETLLESDGVILFLFSDDYQWLEFAVANEITTQINTEAKISVQEPLIQLLFSEKPVYFSNSVSRDTLLLPLLQTLLPAKQVQTCLCAALDARRDRVGMLLIWREKQIDFTDDHGRLVGVFANQVALALENVWLYDQHHQLVIEQERNRLARELHDIVTQSLYSIGMGTQTALQHLDNESEAGEIRRLIEYSSDLAQDAFTKIREALYHVTSTTLTDIGLIKSIEQYCDFLSSHYGLLINFTVTVSPAFTFKQQEAIYYTIREALWNIIKHANATHININLASKDSLVELSITDNGIGFDTAVSQEKGRLGLHNMAERIHQIQGSFNIQSSHNEGTQILIRLPQFNLAPLAEKEAP